MKTENPMTIEELIKMLADGKQAVVIVNGDIYDLSTNNQ